MNYIFSKHKIWFFFTALAALCWGIWGVLSKFISDDISPFTNQILFTIGMLTTVPFIAKRCKAKEFSYKGIILGFIAGILAILGNVSVFQSFGSGGLAAVVIPLTNLYPLVTIIIALLIFKEKLNWLNGIGILIVIPAILLLSGQILLLKDPLAFFSALKFEAWLIFALIAMLLFGLFSACQKVTANQVSSEWSYISFLASSVFVSVIFIILGMVDFSFSKQSFWVGSMAGMLDSLGVLFIYSAYRVKGKASQVSTIAASLQQVFTIAVAILFLKEELVSIELIGIVLAILGASLLTLEGNEKSVKV
jgi:uncharacterized membrane protein